MGNKDLKRWFFGVWVLALFCVRATAADTYNGGFLRVDVSLGGDVTSFDDNGAVDYLEGQLAGILTVQSDQGLYGRLGFKRHMLDEIQIGGEVFDVDEKYGTTLYGLGYRLPLTIGQGLYWGVGYQSAVDDRSGVNPLHSGRLFLEKEQRHRYGVISLAYMAREDDYRLFEVSGTHIWFFDGGLGLGVNWGLGAGESDIGNEPEADVTKRYVGLAFMARLKAHGL
jgi:hypothetical protein